MRRCSDKCLAFIIFAGCLALYVPTIATSIGWTDAGELMAVAATMGIAHPTGYPLLTLLSRTWLLLPFDLRVLTQLNLFVSVLVAAAMSWFFLLLRGLDKTGRKERGDQVRWPAVAATGFLATSTTVWTQATSYEAYALQLLLLIGILATWFAAIREQSPATSETTRWWFVFALLVGFGFANHMTTVLLAPALLWHYFRTYGSTTAAWRRVARLVPFGLTGLSLYLMLPVRSNVLPPLNWGAPSDWESFWTHVGGAQYRLWMFTGWNVVERQWNLFVGGLPDEFIVAVFPVALWGMIILGRTGFTMAITFGLLAVTTVVYSINYDMYEIGPYFLPFYVVVAITTAIGMADVVRRLSTKGVGIRAALPLLAVCAIAWQIVSHREDVRREAPSLVEQFASTTLAHVPPNSVILTGRWDFLYSPSLYLQHVERTRPDVVLIDHSLLRDRSWYLDGVRRRGPGFDQSLANEFDHFRRELRKFERGDPFSPAVIQFRWNALVDGIIRESLRRGPVFVDQRLAGEVRGRRLRPDGFLLRVDGDPDTSFAPFFPPVIPIDAKESAFLTDFKDYCSMAYLQHAQEAARNGNRTTADSLIGIARRFTPNHPALTAFRLP